MLCQDSFSENVVLALEQAFHNPARKLTKSRGKNIHRFASAKMGKRVTVESALECDACLICSSQTGHFIKRHFVVQN